MQNKGFYIQRYVRDEQGVYVADGEERSLERDFGYCRYKSLKGFNARGKQKSLYVETYAENNAARVWFNDRVTRAQTTVTLTVCVFGADPMRPVMLTDEELILNAENSLHVLCEYLENHFFVYHDDYRHRKGLFYLSESMEPTTDVIKDIPYLQCDIKLTNVFGTTFDMNDTTIEGWLADGGKEGDNEEN